MFWLQFRLMLRHAIQIPSTSKKIIWHSLHHGLSWGTGSRRGLGAPCNGLLQPAALKGKKEYNLRCHRTTTLLLLAFNLSLRFLWFHSVTVESLKVWQNWLSWFELEMSVLTWGVRWDLNEALQCQSRSQLFAQPLLLTPHVEGLTLCLRKRCFSSMSRASDGADMLLFQTIHRLPRPCNWSSLTSTICV